MICVFSMGPLKFCHAIFAVFMSAENAATDGPVMRHRPEYDVDMGTDRYAYDARNRALYEGLGPAIPCEHDNRSGNKNCETQRRVRCKENGHRLKHMYPPRAQHARWGQRLPRAPRQGEESTTAIPEGMCVAWATSPMELVGRDVGATFSESDGGPGMATMRELPASARTHDRVITTLSSPEGEYTSERTIIVSPSRQRNSMVDLHRGDTVRRHVSGWSGAASHPQHALHAIATQGNTARR